MVTWRTVVLREKLSTEASLGGIGSKFRVKGRLGSSVNFYRLPCGLLAPKLEGAF
uniref:Uncharacterized protein n=1 Tax=Physcomitrium patens TaxID=3218 RepID=A0A2K1KHG8_PHYPA|nr:hypothetical protein PHYPA_009594 [Physcomitrium patens]